MSQGQRLDVRTILRRRGRVGPPFVDTAPMLKTAPKLKNTDEDARLRLLRGVAAFACGAAAAVAVALGAPGAAAAATSCPLSEMTSASQPACFVPFSAVSPFNTPIPANATLAPDNAAVLAHMSRYAWSIDGSNSEFDFNPNALGTRPVFY